MAEVSMKLMKKHALTGRLGLDSLSVGIGVLPCPSYFDQIIFMEARSDRNSAARASVKYHARVHSCDMWLNRQAYIGAITDEWSEIKTQWFWSRLLLCAESRWGRDQQDSDENKHIDFFLANSLHLGF